MKTLKEKISHLDTCYKQLDALKVQDYKEAAAPKDDTDQEPEFEFDKAYSDPEKAIKLLIEIAQSVEEIQTGKRKVIISEAKAAEIKERNIKIFDNVRTISVSPVYSEPRELIVKPKSNKQV